MYLSYILENETPTFGNDPEGAFRRIQIRSIERNDSCNVDLISFSSHVGTHVDAPYHFFQNGSKITDYEADFWIFKHVQIIHLPLQISRWIIVEDLTGQISDETDLLLIKTGFGDFRNHKVYWEDNPGLHSEVGLYLRRDFPRLRTVGFDFISLSRWRDRKEGRLAHRTFLDPDGKGNPVLLIEDMKLSEIGKSTQLKHVLVSPLLTECSNGAPVTVFAEAKQ